MAEDLELQNCLVHSPNWGSSQQWWLKWNVTKQFGNWRICKLNTFVMTAIQSFQQSYAIDEAARWLLPLRLYGSHRAFPGRRLPSLSVTLHLTESFHANIKYDTLYTFQYASSSWLIMPTLFLSVSGLTRSWTPAFLWRSDCHCLNDILIG